MRADSDAVSATSWSDAEWYLEHSIALAPSLSGERPFNGIPSFRLWNDTTGFGYQDEPISLTVFEIPTQSGFETVVREVVWKRWEDFQKIHAADDSAKKAEATLVVRDAPVPVSALAMLLTQAESFRVPIVWLQKTLGITSDAETMGFEFFSSDQPPAILRLTWSESVPDSWKPMIEWWQRVWTFLEECLAKATKRAEHS